MDIALLSQRSDMYQPILMSIEGPIQCTHSNINQVVRALDNIDGLSTLSLCLGKTTNHSRKRQQEPNLSRRYKNILYYTIYCRIVCMYLYSHIPLYSLYRAAMFSYVRMNNYIETAIACMIYLVILHLYCKECVRHIWYYALQSSREESRTLRMDFCIVTWINFMSYIAINVSGVL